MMARYIVVAPHKPGEGWRLLDLLGRADVHFHSFPSLPLAASACDKYNTVWRNWRAKP